MEGLEARAAAPRTRQGSCRASHQQLPGTQVSSRPSPHSPAHLIRALVCLFHPQPPVPAPSHGHACPQACPLCWVVVSSGPSDSSIWRPRASPVTLSPAALARRPRHVSQGCTHPAPPPPMKPRPRDDLPKQSQNPPSPSLVCTDLMRTTVPSCVGHCSCLQLARLHPLRFLCDSSS
ncbi:hypothetical protein MJG53_014701 [Ovis ammon polii x Ovis aries]|uniref:Uncharacterized protein n=1 Tax=Ovis ammon polii x Ovis aries TaxID=2918886 RepID=A0ACB9UH93_9CETA|nr:hypothetical protein MJG53_014701 [Ovis ammon polii x Ovis aries]